MRTVRVSLFLAVFFVGVGALCPPPSKVPRAQTSKAGATPCCSLQQGLRELDFAYYSLREGFESQLYLVGATKQPTDLTIAVYSQLGTSIVSGVTIQPSAKLAIDLRSLLTQRGADVQGEFGEGSVAVFFDGPMMPVGGQLTVTNPALHLVHESEMVENDPGRTDIPSVLNGLWWNLAPGRDARIMVANMSSSAVTADVFLDYQEQRHASAPLAFHPHELKVLSVIELLGQQNAGPSTAPEGGITIIQRGAPPKLIAQGKMLDAVTGFSTTIYFPSPQLENASALHAVGLPIGKPGKDSPFAGMGYFIPHVVVRNLAAAAQTASVTLEYPSAPGWDSTERRGNFGAGSGSSAAAALNPGDFTAQLPLGPMTVGAYSTQDISLADVPRQVAQSIPYASIRIQYSGTPGSMIAEVSSVDQRQDLVVDAMVENESNGWAGSGANPWHLDNDTESFLFLTDMGEQPVRIGFQVGAMGQVYYLGKLRLVPHETRMIDMRKLRDGQQADLEKHTIPAAATDGSVLWIRLDNVPVMGRLAVIRRKGGVASSYDCTQCACPAYYTSTTVGNTCPVLVTTTSQSTAEEWFQPYCNSTQYYQDVTDSSYWSSSDSSIFTVNSTGLITGVGSGTASALASPSPSNECTSYALVGYSCECQSNEPASGSGSCMVQVPYMLTGVSTATETTCSGASCELGIKYRVLDVNGNPINVAGMTVAETSGFAKGSPCEGNFNDAKTWTTDSTGTMTTPDYWWWCCAGGSCTFKFTQTFTVNGYPIVVIRYNGYTGTHNIVTIQCTSSDTSPCPVVVPTP